MANGPNIGGGQNIADITGGIGELLKGFVQGQQIRTQNQEAQARIQVEKDKRGKDILDAFRSQLQSRPDLAANKNYTNIVFKSAKQAGVLDQIPIDPASGGIDVNAFAPKPSAAALFKDPKDATAFLSESPDQRKATYGNAYDFKGYEDALNAKQQFPPGETEVQQRQIYDQLTKIESGDADPNTAYDIIRTYQNSPVSSVMDIPALIGNDPRVMGKLTAKRQAEIADLQGKGIVDEARARELNAQATTLPGLIAAREANYNSEATARLMQVNEKIRNDNAQNAIRSRAVDASFARINATLHVADLTHEDRVTGQQLTHEDRQAALAVRIAMNKGQDPKKAAMADVTAIKDYATQLEAQRKNLVDEAKQFVAQNNPVPDDIITQINDLDGKLKDTNDKLQKASEAVTKIPDVIDTAKLLQAGVTGLKSVNQGVKDNAADMPDFSPWLDKARTIPKAQRKDLISQSKWYKNLDGKERAAFLMQLQNVP
jgi:hypothetical protein